ncbi:MAG: DUF4332 domain-containing protein [Pirellulales bacterium]
MDLIIPILRAARCRSTHHFFAIDALERIGTPRGKLLRDMLLKYYGDYLNGSKDPDDCFRDFQNHVIHVSQNNWGGAPKACEEWLAEVFECLSQERWREAAYACGVLSHYFTDPIMPLHTGQTERENLIHRPMEWSICKAYEEIYELCRFNHAEYHLELDAESGWMRRAVLSAASISHQHYDRLCEIYNVARGVVDPPRGLTKEARTILADLFDLAIGGWATILTRIAADTQAVLPIVSLSAPTIIATLDVPRAWVVRKITDANERAAVNQLFDEYAKTGAVEQNLPQEIRVVRKESKRPIQRDAAADLTESTTAPKQNKSIDKLESKPQTPKLVERVMLSPPPEPSEPPRTLPPQPPAEEPQQDIRPAPQPEVTPPRSRQIEPEPKITPASRKPETPDIVASESRIDLHSPLVDAPSIGPKTADRFAQIGIHTIGDFLAADPDEMAEQIDTGWIKPELIDDWQAQTELVIEVPALCGYKAQLLVAVGCRSADELAEADPDKLFEEIGRFCRTKEAQRILRSATHPTLRDIVQWIDSASHSEPTELGL